MAMPTSLLISRSLYTRDLIRLSGLTPMRAAGYEHGAPVCSSQEVQA